MIILLSLIGGLLGAYAGAYKTSKACRRYGLTILYTVYALIGLWNLLALLIVSIFYPLSRGYGIPTPPILPDVDPGDYGSTLGRFWYRVFKSDYLYSDIFTRGTIGLMCVLSVIIIPILKGNWLEYFLYGTIVICSWGFVSWGALGIFKFLKKDLCWADMINYSLMTYCILKIIG